MGKRFAKCVMGLFLIGAAVLLGYYQATVTEAPTDNLEVAIGVPPYIDLMFMFSILTVSIFFEIFLSHNKLSIPYGALTIVLGVLLGIAAYYNPVFRFMCKSVRVSSDELLNFYIPVLLFNIVYCSDVHILLKSFSQILVIGVVGSLTTSCLFGLMAMSLIGAKWTTSLGILFGILCSPLSPKHVSSLLKQQSTRTRQINVLLEGEALCSLVIADIFASLCRGYINQFIITWSQFALVILRFLIFGTITGYIFGMIARSMMKTLSTNKISAYVICFGMPYLTYIVAKKCTAGFGSLSVVILGAILNVERSIANKDMDRFLVEFWDSLGFIMDVFICVVNSMLGTFQVFPYMKWVDYIMCFGTYLLYYIVRFGTFLLLSPITKRLGYGMDLRNIIVCTWSGLKTPFSVEMVSYLISRNFPKDAAKPLYFNIMSLYFLSTIINGPFAETILRFLGLTQISAARQLNMNSCMKHLLKKRNRTIALLKMDRFLADTNWPIVYAFTNIRHPYYMEMTDDIDDEFYAGDKFTFCGDCKKEIAIEPTQKEMREMTKEARMRILKAKKISYTRQYENGMISAATMRVLSQAVEIAIDTEMGEVKIEDLTKKFTEETCFQKFIRKRTEALHQQRGSTIRPPRTYWRRVCYHMVVTNRRFSKIMLLILAINIGFIAMEVYYHPEMIFLESHEDHHSAEHQLIDYIILVSKIVFFLIYLFEFVVKILAYSWIRICAHGFRTYFKFVCNIVDFFVLICMVFSIVNTSVSVAGDEDELAETDFGTFGHIIEILSLVRVLRIFQFFDIFYADIIHYLDGTRDNMMALLYELGKCYVTTEDEIGNMLPYMVDNVKIRDAEMRRKEKDKVYVMQILGMVQKERPWIAITVKTKQAIRTVLNSMAEAIYILKSTGWIDAYEYARLSGFMVELNTKVNSIKKVQPSEPKVIFKEVSWMADDETVIDFLFENVEVKKFEPGEIVYGEEDTANNIYIVVTGILMITYQPKPMVLKALKEDGRLPIADYITSTKYEENTVEYLVAGNCIGELSLLTDRVYNCVITAESHSVCYALSRGVVNRAIELNRDPVSGLECRMWKEVAIRIVAPLLSAVPAYQSLSIEQIKYVLERGFVPDLSNYKIFIVNELIEDIILVEGLVSDFNSRTLYKGPCCLPRTVQKLILPPSSLMNVSTALETRLLIIPTKDVDEYEVMMIAEETCEMVNTGSYTKCLKHLVQTRRKRGKKQTRAMLGVSPGISKSTRTASTAESHTDPSFRSEGSYIEEEIKGKSVDYLASSGSHTQGKSMMPKTSSHATRRFNKPN